MNQNYLQFFTATNLWWKKLLQPDKYKQIIIDSLKFLAENKRVKVYGLVIMPNHIHNSLENRRKPQIRRC